MLRALLATTFALALTSVVVGCGHHPVKVKETTGPDGSADWKQITCKRMDKRCFKAARAICPNGYVFTDGRPGDIKVSRSLDRTFGLDEEAMKAMRLWRFRPGMRQGAAVPTIITVEMEFSLR